MSWAELLKDGRAMKKAQGRTLGQMALAANTPTMLKSGLVDGDTNAGVLASGQVVGVIDDLPTCEELIDRIVLRAVDELRRAGDLPGLTDTTLVSSCHGHDTVDSTTSRPPRCASRRRPRAPRCRRWRSRPWTTTSRPSVVAARSTGCWTPELSRYADGARPTRAVIFLDLADLLHIAERTLGEIPGVRDIGLLESARSAPADVRVRGRCLRGPRGQGRRPPPVDRAQPRPGGRQQEVGPRGPRDVPGAQRTAPDDDQRRGLRLRDRRRHQRTDRDRRRRGRAPQQSEAAEF